MRSLLKILFGIVLIIMFATFANAQVDTYRSGDISKQKDIENNCSAVIEGLQFCTSNLFISENVGEKIVLSLSLINTSEKSINVKGGGTFNERYEVILLDEKGEKVLSIFETLGDKQKNNTISEEEKNKLFDLCCVNTMPFRQTLYSREKVEMVLNLNNFFDLSRKGKFTLKLVKKVTILNEKDSFYRKQNVLIFNEVKNFELVLPEIEIEINENAQNYFNIKKYSSDAKCGCSTVGKLQFCAALSFLQSKEGEDLIIVNTSLKNLDDKVIKIPMIDQDVYSLYTISVKAPSGEKLRSKKEILEEQEKNNILAGQEQVITSLPTTSLRYGTERELEPQAELKSEFNLNNFYKFESKGTYKVEVTRKINFPNDSSVSEIKLEPIEIEVK